LLLQKFSNGGCSSLFNKSIINKIYLGREENTYSWPETKLNFISNVFVLAAALLTLLNVIVAISLKEKYMGGFEIARKAFSKGYKKVSVALRKHLTPCCA
jgi:hypothetical protein